MSAPDRLVGGRYRIDERLGTGGMGVVWAAHDELLRRDVAVKEVLLPQDLDDEQTAVLRERTMREARAAARITSPGALTVFDVVEEDGHPWIVMERLPGRTLDDVLTERGSLAPEEAARLGLALLDALGSAHSAGVLHRDVKPGNVMFRGGDDVSRVVLTDFGIAHLDGDATLTTTGMLSGSPAYVAPERARGDAATRASDLWALGATLWAAVEGSPPFLREGPLPTLTAIVTEDVPEPRSAGPLAPALAALLRKDPAERADLREARRLLEEAAGTGTGAAAGAVGAAVPTEPDVAQDAEQDAGPAPEQSATGTLTSPVVPEPDTEPEPEPEPESEPEPVPELEGEPTPPPPDPEPSRDPEPSTAREETGSRPTAPAPRPDTGRPRPTAPAPRREPDRGPDRGPDETGPPRRGVVLGVGLAVLAVVVGLGVLAVRLAGGDDGNEQVAAPSSASASATASVSPEPSEAADPASSAPEEGSDEDASPSPAADGGDEEAPGVPDGFERYSDPTGFSIAVPAGWTVTEERPRVRFSDPDTGRYLLVDQTDDPSADPVADWQRQEESVSQRLENYELIGIDGLDFRGWEAADWEFTFGSDTHVLNRNLLVSDSQAYALYWSASDGSWDESLEQFQQIAQTFQPAG